MKQILLALSIGAFAVSQSYSANVAITGGATADSATLISTKASELNGNTFLWKGLNKNIVVDQMSDAYVRIDTDVSMKDMMPSGGGAPHVNANFIFDNGMTMNITGSLGINFNDYGTPPHTASYALGYYFSTAEGNTATVNLVKQTFNLACSDNNFGGKPDNYQTFGNFGRIVSVGKGITMNSTEDFVVKGGAGDTSPNSEFILDGTVNSNTAVVFRDTVLTQGETGVVKSTGDLKIENTTAYINGTLTGNSVFLGGDVQQASTSKIVASAIVLTGGDVKLNGSAQTSSESELVLKVNADTNLWTNSNIKVNELKFGAGTINLNTSMSANTINMSSNDESAIKTSGNSKLTINGATTLASGSKLTIDGAVDFNNTLLFDPNGSLTIAKDASVSITKADEALAFRTSDNSTTNIYGNLTVSSKTGSWHSTSVILKGTNVIDGGSLTALATGKYSSGIQVNKNGTLSLKNGGSVFTNKDVFLQVQDAKLSTDGTASINVGGLMFANGTKNNAITIAKASELKSDAVIFAQGAGDGTGSKLDLNLLSGDYEFGAVWSLRKAEINLYLGEDATVSFGKVIPQSTGAVADLTLVLHDFTLNTIKLGNVDNDMISGNVINIASSGNISQTVTLIGYDKDKNLLDANSWYIDSNGFLANYALAVPEPAEWAMILGGLALALAVYRRRK